MEALESGWNLVTRRLFFFFVIDWIWSHRVYLGIPPHENIHRCQCVEVLSQPPLCWVLLKDETRRPLSQKANKLPEGRDIKMPISIASVLARTNNNNTKT